MDPLALASAEPPKSDRADWLARRRRGIGGSDAAAILGLDPLHSATAVWLDKLGLRRDEGGNEAMRWGSLLEGIVADEFEERTGLSLRDRQLEVVHPDHEWMRATLDARVFEGPGADEPLGIYEGKTTGAWRFGQVWRSEDGTYEAPDWVQIQCQHNMAVAGLDHAWVSCLVGGQRLVWFEVERDDELIANLVAFEAEFWRRLQDGLPPVDIDGSVSTRDALRAAWDPADRKAVELPDEAADLLHQRQEAKAEIAAAEKVAATAEHRLMALMQDAEVGLVDGVEVVTWKGVTSRVLDQKSLRASNPRIADRFTVLRASRRFWVTSKWKETTDNGDQP